ncbi:hypothetical protein ACF1FX_13835 [Streptomyces sp. NPDC014646]|uniref:hypothetical protein n=1 Tax=unclassified Streptomyces TaxID=2593676 RepID=UPI001301916A
MRDGHRSECAEQMQGQMHVHAPDLSDPVPVLGHFFLRGFSQLYEALPVCVIE